MANDPKSTWQSNEPDHVQGSLVELAEPWQDAWRGMPKFVQEERSPFKTIYVHFETRADYDAFAKLVDQSLTMQTRGIWYPAQEIDRTIQYRWVDAERPEDDGAVIEDLPAGTAPQLAAPRAHPRPQGQRQKRVATVDDPPNSAALETPGEQQPAGAWDDLWEKFQD